jgi:hypothetical protein
MNFRYIVRPFLVQLKIQHGKYFQKTVIKIGDCTPRTFRELNGFCTIGLAKLAKMPMPLNSVAILPITDSSGRVTYQAIFGSHYATGRTAGEALDALTAQFPSLTSVPLLMLQRFQGDEFFNMLQQNRLTTLMAQWRNARDKDQPLAASQNEELESLVATELDAAIARTRALIAAHPEA